MATESTTTPATEKLAQSHQQRSPLGFVLSNWDDAWRAASQLAKSGLIPKSLQGKPDDVMVVLLTGAEIGLSPMQALREMYVVYGRASMSTLLKIALVQKSPECLSWKMLESTDKQATFETHRKGDAAPVKMTFTIEDARKAGLLTRKRDDAGPSNWEMRPKLMLRRRAAGELIDEVYPDVIKGIESSDDGIGPSKEAAEEVFLSRVRAPPMPEETAPAPTEAEVSEVAEVVDPAPEQKVAEEQRVPVGEMTDAEKLAVELTEAQTLEQLKNVGFRVHAAKSDGKITDEDRKVLSDLFVKQQAEIRRGGQ